MLVYGLAIATHTIVGFASITKASDIIVNETAAPNDGGNDGGNCLGGRIYISWNCCFLGFLIGFWAPRVVGGRKATAHSRARYGKASPPNLKPVTNTDFPRKEKYNLTT